MGNYLTDVMTNALEKGYTISIETRKALLAWDCRVVVSNGKYCHARDIPMGSEYMLNEDKFPVLISAMIAYIERVEDVKRRATDG